MKIDDADCAAILTSATYRGAVVEPVNSLTDAKSRFWAFVVLVKNRLKNVRVVLAIKTVASCIGFLEYMFLFS